MVSALVTTEESIAIQIGARGVVSPSIRLPPQVLPPARTTFWPSYVARVRVKIMRPHLRKLALTAHVTFSVGWLGAVASFLALPVAALISGGRQTVRVAYVGMELTGWYVIVRFASLRWLLAWRCR
jgi:hypothetical protein